MPLVLALAALTLAAPVSAPPAVDALVREACLETGGDRARLTALARARGWASAPMPGGMSTDKADFADGYAVEGARIGLVHYPAGATGGGTTGGAPHVQLNYPAASLCVVEVPAPAVDWRDRLSALFATVPGMGPMRTTARPDGAVNAFWSGRDVGFVEARYASADPVLTITWRLPEPPSIP